MFPAPSSAPAAPAWPPRFPPPLPGPIPTLDGPCAPSSHAKPSPLLAGSSLFLPHTAPASTKCVHSHKSPVIQAAPTCSHTTLPKVPTSLFMPPVCPAVAFADRHILPGLPELLIAFYGPRGDQHRLERAESSPACTHGVLLPSAPAHGTHARVPKPTRPEGYFHSTMLMHAFRSGFSRVKQNRALAGRGAAGGTGFLDFSFCCLFFPSSWGEAGSMVFLP